MKIISCILIISFGLGLNAYSQSGHGYNNKKSYLERFEKAKRLIANKKYSLAKNVLTGLISQKDIDIVGCDVKSEISNQLGVVFFLMDDIISAFKIWKEKTLPLREECDSVDRTRLAQTYYNIGYAYSIFCDYKESNKYAEKALSLIDRLDFPIDKYITWCLLPYINYRHIGDYNNAEGYVFKAISYLEAAKITDSVLKAKLYIDIGRNFINKNEFTYAEEYFDKAKTILLKDSTDQLALLFENYATLFWFKENYLQSIEWSKKAIIQSDESMNSKKDIAKIYNTLGLALSYNNDFSKALYYYFKALKLKKLSNANNIEISVAYENISGAYGRKGDLDSALYYIDLSIEKLHNFGDRDLPKEYLNLRESDYNKSSMVRNLQMKGKFLTRKYRLEKDINFLIDAENQFDKADSLIFLLRKDIRDNESKVILGSSLDTIYKYAIDNAFTLWEATKNKKYLERGYKYIGENKAIVFSETKEELNAVWEILDSDLRNEYLKILDDLKSNMYQKQYAVLKDDSLAYQQLNTEFLNLSLEKEKLFEKIKTNYPDFYQRIYGELEIKSIKDLQRGLDDNNAILEYYIDGKKLYLFSITKSNFIEVKQKIDMDADSLFNAFGEELTSFSNSESIRDLSKKVYPILFPVKLKRFLDTNLIKRLIVIRDKSLNKIPFGSVMTGEDINKDFLIFDYSFSYAFNNKYIWDRSVTKQKKEFDFIGFATNYNKETLEDIKKDVIFWIGTFPPVLKPLERSVDEVKAISKQFNSKSWIGNNATYENFAENANKSKMLHLSLHSLIASNNNEQNGLIFQNTDTNRKFILKSSDLIGMRLDNSLSILSSCYSSDGSVVTGEGINSLARSFALAGSPAIVASQWQAYEGQTRDILVGFYSYLKKGYSKDIALQKAKQDYILRVKEKFVSPANWANLVLLGDYSAVDLDSNEFGLWSKILLLIFILGIYLFFKYRRNNKNDIEA